MYLHIIYKNGEKGGINLDGKENFSISDSFDSDVYVDAAINTNVLVKDNKLKFEGLDSEIVVEHVSKNGDFYELPCSILTNNVNLIFTLKEKSLEDFEYRSPEDISQSEQPSALEDNTDSDSETESLEQLVKNNSGLAAAEGSKEKVKPNTGSAQRSQTNSLKKRNIIYIAVIAGSLLLVLLLFMFYKMRHHLKIFSGEKPKAALVQPATLEQTLAKIEKLYPKLIAKQNSSKSYDLVGIVANSSQINQISALAKPFKSSINLQIFDAETIKANISNVFKKHNIHQYYIAITDTNTVLIKYFGDDNTDVDAVQSDIIDKYPADLEDSFSIQVSMLNELQDILENLERKYSTIATKIENGTVNITGSISQDNQDNINQDIKEIETAYRGLLSFVVNIKLNTQILPIKIAMVYTGYPSWIILDNGKQIYQGEDYNGFVLQKITEDKAVFSGKYPVEVPIE